MSTRSLTCGAPTRNGAPCKRSTDNAACPTHGTAQGTGRIVAALATLAPSTRTTPLPTDGVTAQMLTRPVSGDAVAASFLTHPLAAPVTPLPRVSVPDPSPRVLPTTTTHGGGAVAHGVGSPAHVARRWAALAGDTAPRGEMIDTRSMCPTLVTRDDVEGPCGAPRMAGRATCKRHARDTVNRDPQTLTASDARALAAPVTDVSRGDTRDGAAIIAHAPLSSGMHRAATRSPLATAWPIPIDHPSRKGSAATYALTGAAQMLSDAPIHPRAGVLSDDDADTLALTFGDDVTALRRLSRVMLHRDAVVRMPAADASALVAQSADDVAADAALILAAYRERFTYCGSLVPIPATRETRAATPNDDAATLAARGWTLCADGSEWSRVPRPLAGVGAMRAASVRDAVRRQDRYGVSGSRGSGVRVTDDAVVVTWQRGDGAGNVENVSQTLTVGDSTAPRRTGGALHIGVSTLRTHAPTDGDTLARAMLAVACPRLRAILAVPAKGRQTASVLRDAYAAHTGRSPRNVAALDRWIDAARTEWEAVAAHVDTLRDAHPVTTPDAVEADAAGLTVS